MSRMSALLTSPKLMLGSLGVVLVAGVIAVGSGATFTSNSANAANTFSAGILSQSNNVSGAILTAANMKPTTTVNGQVTITNTGNIPGTFTLTKKNLVDTAGSNGGVLSSILDLKVEDVTVPASPVTIYSGKLGAMGAQALGTFAAGAAKTYKFTVTFPDGGTPPSSTTGDNAYKGSSLTVDYSWDAVQ